MSMAGASRSAKGSLPKRSLKRHPRGHRAGHGDAVPAALRRRRRAVAVLAAEVLRRPGRRRGAGGVEAVQLRAVPQDAEGVGAQAVAAGLDDRHRGRRGDGRIHRVAAVGQHAQPGLRGQRVRGGDDVAREHRPARRGVARCPSRSGGSCSVQGDRCVRESWRPSDRCRPAPARRTAPGCWPPRRRRRAERGARAPRPPAAPC